MASTVSYNIIQKIDASKIAHTAQEKTQLTTINNNNEQYTIKYNK